MKITNDHIKFGSGFMLGWMIGSAFALVTGSITIGSFVWWALYIPFLILSARHFAKTEKRDATNPHPTHIDRYDPVYGPISKPNPEWQDWEESNHDPD